MPGVVETISTGNVPINAHARAGSQPVCVAQSDAGLATAVRYATGVAVGSTGTAAARFGVAHFSAARLAAGFLSPEPHPRDDDDLGVRLAPSSLANDGRS